MATECYSFVEHNVSTHGCFEGKQKGEKFLKPKRPCPSKLVCIHFTSTSISIKFLGLFFFDPHELHSPWSKREIRPFLKLIYIHFTSISTCMNFFGQFYFWPPWTIHCTTQTFMGTLTSLIMHHTRQ